MLRQRPFACGWLGCRPVSGGGGISEQSSTVLGGGGMAEHDSLVVGGNGIADRDRSVVGAVGIIEHDSAVMGAAGMAEQSSAILGGGGISEHDSFVVGGGGIAEQDNAMLGGGGIAVPVSTILGGGGTTGTERTSSSASPEVTTALFPDSIPLCCVLLPIHTRAPDRASRQRGQKPRQTEVDVHDPRRPGSPPPRPAPSPAHPPHEPTRLASPGDTSKIHLPWIVTYRQGAATIHDPAGPSTATTAAPHMSPASSEVHMTTRVRSPRNKSRANSSGSPDRA